LQQCQDLALVRESVLPLLREDERAVAHDVELALRALADRRVEALGIQLGRETRGPPVVAASDRAVEDLDAHGASVADGSAAAQALASGAMAAGLSDAELVARCRAGEEAAWNELVERFSRYVYAICTQGFRLGSEDAEDVFQEVFARAYEHLDRLRTDEALRPWLAQLTRRLCVDRLRAGRREVPGDEGLEPRDVDETLATLDDAMTVRACLDAIGAACKEILDRFFGRDESYRAIGEALGLPPGTVASRISRCLRKLRLELEGRN
jgi:RNA polymerase sigma factor (sigma-70 family)